MELNNAFYIKLGRGGEWEVDAISSGKIRFGWREQSLSDINDGRWDIIQQQLRQAIWLKSPGQATRAFNGLKSICTSTPSDIWITFHKAKLWWTRLSTEPTAEDTLSKFRTTITPWSDKNEHGKLLVATDLPGKLAQLQAYRWTMCNVQHKEILKRVLEGRSSPMAQAIARQRSMLADQLAQSIQELHWKDFEILVDLVFRASGWIRVSVLGQQAKGYDLELREPITGDRYIVQIKARAGLEDIVQTSTQYSSSDYRRIYFAVHTPTKDLANAEDLPENVELLLPNELAERVIDAGLISWLEEKME